MQFGLQLQQGHMQKSRRSTWYNWKISVISDKREGLGCNYFETYSKGELRVRVR